MKKSLRNLIDKVARFYVFRIKSYVDKHIELKQKEDVFKKLPVKTKNLFLNGKVIFTSPEMVVIGDNVHIGNNCFFYSDGGLIIEDNVHISRNLTVYTSNHRYNGTALPYDEYRDYKPVKIGKNVWIGMNVSITPGVTIGEGAIIGIGAVISKDVPSYCIVGNSPQRILKERNIELYKSLDNEGKYGGKNGKLIRFNDSTFKSAFDLGEKLFFIVGTGRSGSQSISEILSQHPDVSCSHENKGMLIRLSTEYEEGVKSKKEVKKILIDLYTPKNIRTDFYGESDQKLSNLIPILSEIFPKAKFIWLIRNPKDIITSTVSRGWFEDREFGYISKELDSSERIYVPEVFSINRLNGFKINAFSEIEWRKMSVFERNCWYWYYWNLKIQKGLDQIESDKKFKVKLEELEQKIYDLALFLDIPEFKFKVIKANKGTYRKIVIWDKKLIKIFSKYSPKTFGYNLNE